MTSQGGSEAAFDMVECNERRFISDCAKEESAQKRALDAEEYASRV
jgi:hypothetical protein